MMVMREETMDFLAEEIGRLTQLNAELLAALKRLQEAPCPDRYDKRWTEAEAVTAKAEAKP